MARGRAPSHKQAKKSFIETSRTARSFLGESFTEEQIALLMEARNTARDVRAILNSFFGLMTAVNGWDGMATELPPAEGLNLRIPAAVQGNKDVQEVLAIAVRLAGSLTDFAQVPAFRPIFIEWCRERWSSLRYLRRISPDLKRLEAAVIKVIAKAAQLPPLNERHLAALAVLEPEPMEPPEARIPFMKSRVDRWRYALNSGGDAFNLSASGMFPPPPRWEGTRQTPKSRPIGSLG